MKDNDVRKPMGLDDVSEGKSEEAPPLPIAATIYFRCGQPLEIVCTAIEPQINPQTGRIFSGVIEQRQARPGEWLLPYVDWDQVYAIEVRSV